MVGAVLLADPLPFVTQLLAVIKLPALRDSKKLTALQRERIYAFAAPRLDWAVGEVSATEIDQLGLRSATDLAAGRALSKLRGVITEVIADAGLHHPHEEQYPTQFFVKGDERFAQIALASCLAKVTRDRQMQQLSAEYPDYGWQTNVGYGSAQHYAALCQLGPTPLHRRSFIRKVVFS